MMQCERWRMKNVGCWMKDDGNVDYDGDEDGMFKSEGW